MLTSLAIAITFSQQGKIDVVATPPQTSANSYYWANRAPLAPNPLVKLPVGSVTAKGWVHEYLVRQKNGMTGHLPEISEWLRKEDNAWTSTSGKGNGGWEEVPYWLRGYISLAYQLRDPKMIQTATDWIEAAIRSQRPNGDFGPDQRFQNGDRDFWGNMLMLSCLRTYYEATKDQRVIELMTNYFHFQLTVPDDHFLTGYWQKARGADNLASIYWLYNITKDGKLLTLGEKTHRRTMNWSQSDTLPDWHNVNVAESFDEPGIYYQQTKDAKNLEAAYGNFATMRRLYGQVPGGMYAADENARKGQRDPRQAIETCGIVEQMLSDEELLAISGDVKWADHCEDVAFNSYPAAVMPDFSALRYLTSPNMVTADGFNHAPGFQNEGPMSLFNPLSHRCCQHNHSMGWPFFAEHMWMATNDNGLAAVLYSANSVTAKAGDGRNVTIEETTHYPFDESIELKISTGARANRFPLYLRLPEWCSSPRISVNGSVTSLKGKRGYAVVDRNWKTGDRVKIDFPMTIGVTTWTENMNSKSVSYGPLTFSLKIKELTTKEDATKSTEGDSHWQKTTDFSKWPAYQLMPGSTWNYALASDSFQVVKRAWPKSDFPWTQKESPISIEAKGKVLPQWGVDRTGLVAKLQPSPTVSKSKTESIELIPMGAARLRISSFPWVSASGKAWKETPKPLPWHPMASHCFGGDTVEAMDDQVLPSSSADETVPRMTFWDHKGTQEWAQYTFDKPRTVNSVGVYWFDDTGKGMCRVPKFWKVLGRVGDQWLPIPTSVEHGVAKDRFNTVSFGPVQVTGLRLVIQLQDGFSAGILEWRVR